MKYAIVFLVLVSGCGVKVDGLRDVKVIHEVQVKTLEPYLEAYCAAGNDDPVEIEACMNYQIGKILSQMGGAQ